MIVFLVGIVLIVASGLVGLMLPRQAPAGERLACGLTLLGVACCALALPQLLYSGETLRQPWALPAGQLVLAVDGLAAVFIVPLLLVLAATALYGLGYWPQRHHPTSGRKLRLFFGLTGGALLLLLASRDAILFLVSWEIMALGGYFLVTAEDDKALSRQAGYLYLIATHSGTLALFALFALLEQLYGSTLFPVAASLPAAPPALFGLALLGFGVKAGLMPLHIWLPAAHAAAPSHASALLSGVLIKSGIYGLVRLTSFFAAIPPWWGWTLLGLGALSAVFGVVLALAQHDIKRLLAYHSVENIGIIALGLGLALLGRSYEAPALVALGLSGALLHTLNHGLFKSLLFLSAGAVIQRVGSRRMDAFGGLLRTMPLTGLLFLGAAVAICGLPPLNGFISEWLIYLGAFEAVDAARPLQAALLVAPVLALVGGLALACFVKVFGISFLGQARTAAAQWAHEASALLLGPMALLLLVCGLIGLLPQLLMPLLRRAVRDWWPGIADPAAARLTDLAPLGAEMAPLASISRLAALVLLLSALVWWWLRRRARPAPLDQPTWGCGYGAATPRMQYSASSFAALLVGLFRFSLATRCEGRQVRGLLPQRQDFASHSADPVLDGLLDPLARGLCGLFQQLRRWIQNGRLAAYLLYVAVTLLVLLFLTR